MSQLTLDFQPTLPERFASLREFVAHRSVVVAKHLKVQAAEMDLAPSTLSRKLNPADGDTQRFNLDDLESWIKSTGDASAVIEYLAAKYLDTDGAKQARMVRNAEKLMADLAGLVAHMKVHQA